MTIIALSTAEPAEAAKTLQYTASIGDGFDATYDLWEGMAHEGAALPFQRRAWLEPWAATKGRHKNLDLLAVTLRDAAGTPVVGLPLVRERGGLKRIGFADGGLADYNGPILSARAPQDENGAKALWRATLKALPRCDVVRFERMPLRIGSHLNPFALLPGAKPVPFGGLSLEMPGPYEDWLRAKPRRYRMELNRCSRLFDAVPEARFEHVTSDVDHVFDALEKLQSQRINTLGRRYVLDETDEADFYRAVVTGNRVDGTLTALRVGEDVVAAMFGIRRRDWFVMLRIGASEEWSHLSPARLLIIRTMEILRGQGVHTFDFGLGDYPYKRRLGAEPVALRNFVAARSPLGLVETSKFRVGAAVRENPRLFDAAKRVRDRARAVFVKP